MTRLTVCPQCQYEPAVSFYCTAVRDENGMIVAWFRFSKCLSCGFSFSSETTDDLALARQWINEIPAHEAFRLWTQMGLPIEVTCDVAAERGATVDRVGFNEMLKWHAVASGRGGLKGAKTKAKG